MADSQDLLLLTGASGFIGIHVLQLLLSSTQHRVRIALRPTASLAAILSLPSVAPHAHRVESFIVPDIETPGAYDDAVRGVRFVIHCASPLTRHAGEDMDATVVQPTVRGTMNMLEAAAKEPGIEKVIMTASLASIASPLVYPGSHVLVNEETRMVKLTGPPWSNPLEAYVEGKATAFAATEKFIAHNKPHFSVINIMPSSVLGPNPLFTTRSAYSGTPALVVGPLRGNPYAMPRHGLTVHVDDVARMHLEALLRVNSHEVFIVNSDHRGITFADAAEIVKRRFPSEVANGLLDVQTMAKGCPTIPSCADGRKAEKFLGTKYKTFEEQVVDTLQHYLSLEEA